VTQQSVYFGGKKYPKPAADVRAAVTPRMRHLVVAYRAGTRVRFQDLTAGCDLGPEIEGEAVATSGGRFYVKQRENLLEIEIVELARHSLLGVKVVGNVMMSATRMFEGGALQNLLGAYHASILPESGVCHQVHLRELDGCQIIEARLDRRVLIVVVHRAGRYDRLIFRFSEDFNDYDVRVGTDVNLTNINFTVLDSGVSLHLNDEDELEVFSALKGSAKIRVISDTALRGDVRLFRTGSQALFGRGHKLYKLSLRQPPA
jgi:hypothetical protein